MDLAIIAEAFVVTVVVADWARYWRVPLPQALIGLTCAVAVHRARDGVTILGIEFAFLKLTLVAGVPGDGHRVVWPHGSLGTFPAPPPTTAIAEFRALVKPLISQPHRVSRVGSSRSPPFAGDEYRLVLATDILLLALFAASLQLLMGT